MKVPAAHHRLVSLAIMETFVRYNRVLQHSQHCLPSVLQTFLGDKGIGHPDKVTDPPTLSSPVYPPLQICTASQQALSARDAASLPGKPCKGPSWNHVLVPTFACCVRSRMQSAPFDHAPAAELPWVNLHRHQLAWSRVRLQHYLAPNVQAVATRACYLFSRLAKSLRQNLRPLLSDILVRLQPHLAHILANPLPEAEPATKGAAYSVGL